MCSLSIRSEPAIESSLFNPSLPELPTEIVVMVLNKISDPDLLIMATKINRGWHDFILLTRDINR
jgi:hypothetical protein